MSNPGGWYSTEIAEREDGVWCGGICHDSLEEAQNHQKLITTPTQTGVAHGIIRHTKPHSNEWGFGYEIWFEYGGKIFRSFVDAINASKRKRR